MKRNVGGLYEGLLQTSQFALHLRYRNALPEPCDDQEIKIGHIAHLVRTGHERLKDLVWRGLPLGDGAGHLVHVGKAEASRQDAHDGLSSSTYVQCASDCAGISCEVFLPGAPGENDYVLVSFGGFDGLEASA